MFSVKEMKNSLRERGLSPKKWLGQNFLADCRVLQKIIDAADIKQDDIILEIGPGLGVLTLELAKNAKKVVAIEKDEKLAEILNKELRIKNIKNVEVVVGDILKIENLKLKIKNFKVVANLPYYITAPVIRKFLESKNQPADMVLMVQKEVGQRICAKPPAMNLLAVSVQIYAEPKIIAFVSKKSFWPQPKVDSAILRIAPRTLIDNMDMHKFFQIVKAGFSQPRKQILNNFAKGLKLDKDAVAAWLEENGIKSTRRAETLNMEDWTRLCLNF